MTATAATTASAMVAEAKKQVTNLTPAQVAAEIGSPGVLLVDIREPEERAQNGMIPGSIHAPRGMLEFYADPASPYHRPEFDRNGRTILYCASGGRSALAALALQALGYRSVAHLDGGIKGWLDNGKAVVADGRGA